MGIPQNIVFPADRSTAFKMIYDQRMLGEYETVSGKNSTLMRTRNLRKSLAHMLENGVFTSILDVGCGDFNWMSAIDLKNIEYTGVEIVPELIQNNRERYSAPNIMFECLDIAQRVPVKRDFAICRDVFSYLSRQDIVHTFNNIKKSGARYIAITGEHPPKMKEKKQEIYRQKLNIDGASGYWRAINMRESPFFFCAPKWIIHENEPGVTLDIWALDDLPLLDYVDILNPPVHNPASVQDFMAYPFFRALCALPFIQKIALFGSRAIDKHKPESDIDLMFYCDPDTTRKQWLEVCEIIRKTNIRLPIDCLRYADSLRTIMDKWPPDFKILYERK